MNKSINTGLSEGDLVRLRDSYCSHYGESNAYLGFEGIVKIDNKDEGRFSLFSGESWLTNLSINDDRFTIIKRNELGLFSINGVYYYSKESVLNKPRICCKCKFIPVNYIIVGIFYNKYYCDNCIKTKKQ